MTASFWIKKLKLKPHPEGGYYRETYRSKASTAIYYLLEKGDCSKLHRIKQDEVWHFYAGDPVVVWSLDKRGKASKVTLGKDSFQTVVPGGHWFGAYLPPKSRFALIGCTVAPAFTFKDFQLANPQKLLNLYSRYRKIILKLT